MMNKQEIIEIIKTDERALKFARLQNLGQEDLKSVRSEPGESKLLLYSDLMVNYVLKTEKSQELRRLNKLGGISDAEMHQKENEILIELLTESGLIPVQS